MTTGNVFCDRLMNLASFLDTIPEKNFDYSSYVDNWDGKSQDLISCGSTACALGWAAMMPEIAALGVVLSPSETVKGLGYVTFTGDKITPNCNQSLDVGRKVFDLTIEEFYFLFMPDHHMSFDDEEETSYCSPDENASAKEVANHIRLFVRNKYRHLL